MWLNEEILSAMFQEKVKNNRWELESSKKRNQDLNEKCKRLEEERKVIDERLENSQLEMVTQKNKLNSLLDELKSQKKINMSQAQRLQISNEQLENLQFEIEKTKQLNDDPLTELKPITEKLTFKWDVVDCLEKLLVSTRLHTAEQEEIISQLKKHESELLKDVNMMKETKPSSVSTWQEEFLDARLKEAKVNLEFEKIRRDLTLLKQEINIEQMQTEEYGSGDFFSIKFNIKDKEQEKLKNQKEISNTVTSELQDETYRLKIQINELKKIVEDISRQLNFNESIKLHLYEVRSSIFQRLYRTNHALEKQMEKTHFLEEKMNQELKRYQENMDGKDIEIATKLRRIEELQTYIMNSTKSNEESMSISNENTLTLLEDKVVELEEKIKELRKENSMTVCDKARNES